MLYWGNVNLLYPTQYKSLYGGILCNFPPLETAIWALAGMIAGILGMNIIINHMQVNWRRHSGLCFSLTQYLGFLILTALVRILSHWSYQVKLRLQTHKANVAAVTDSYKDVITHVSFFIQTCLILHVAITEVKIFNWVFSSIFCKPCIQTINCDIALGRWMVTDLKQKCSLRLISFFQSYKRGKPTRLVLLLLLEVYNSWGIEVSVQ